MEFSCRRRRRRYRAKGAHTFSVRLMSIFITVNIRFFFPVLVFVLFCSSTLHSELIFGEEVPMMVTFFVVVEVVFWRETTPILMSAKW